GSFRELQADVPATSPPEFQSGSAGLKTFLRTNYRYPDALKVTGISGSIVIEFLVDGLGRISDLRIVGGLHPDLDNEALRVVRLTSGKWKPALKYGKPVSQRHTLTLEVTPAMR
ncbi:MAG: energy transducer TonB, partial [Bacteroidales bacterium]|nr:energy transducer TonB [Bacteroidales bacterium]